MTADALANPVNDAKLVSDAMRQRGFDVTMLQDLTTAQMLQAVTTFAERASKADVALFYYAGHAVALDGVNYLFGVDLGIRLADLRIATAQQYSLSMNRVLQILRRAQVRARLVVLDACRTAVTRGTSTAGLVRSVPAGGELIAYSTQPGATAEDGFGASGPRHSPYAFYFAEALRATPATAPVEDVFKQVTADVQVATAYRQVPHYASSIVGRVSLDTLADGHSNATPGPAARSGRGPSAALGRDLIRARMADWEYEIETAAGYIDQPRFDALRARAKAGDVMAITTLGLVAEKGSMGAVDYARAASWYRQAADRGFAPAQTYLGELTFMGRGVSKDFAHAERLFSDAADAGHQRAALDLMDVRMRSGVIDPTQAGQTMMDTFQLMQQQLQQQMKLQQPMQQQLIQQLQQGVLRGQ